ncbi:MAG: hypothetical protein LBK53_04620 [Heliobacteriaceae bacterium]|jgi:hypothetical protein|nr:hypothetical protein [Heliobacteriaceae bacterium]
MTDTNKELIKIEQLNQYYDLSQLKGGVKQTDKMNSIFASYDKNKDGILDAEETAALKQAIESAAALDGDAQKLSNKEAQSLIKNNPAFFEEFRELFKAQIERNQIITDELWNDIHAKTSWGLPTTGPAMGENIKKINSGNVLDVMNSYEAKSKDEKENETLVEAVFDEVGLSKKDKVAYAAHIKDALIDQMKDVTSRDPNTFRELSDKFNRKFDELVKSYGSKIGYYNTKDIDALINEIKETVEDKKALKAYNLGDMNKKIDYDTKQNESFGDCWLLSGTKAFASTEKGQKILKDCMKIDRKNECFKVFIPEAGKEYTVTFKEANEGQITRSGGDTDMRVLEIAIEKYFDEIGENGDPDSGEPSINGNSGIRVFELFKNKKSVSADVENKEIYDAELKKWFVLDLNMFGRAPSAEKEYLKAIKKYIKSLNKTINSGQPVRIINRSVLCREHTKTQQADFEIFQDIVDYLSTKKDISMTCALWGDALQKTPYKNSKEITGQHTYMIKSIDKENVCLINPWDTSKIITVPREEFEKMVLDISSVKP